MKIFWKQFLSIFMLAAFSMSLLGSIILCVTFRINLDKMMEQNEKELWLFRYSLEASLRGLDENVVLREDTLWTIIRNIYENTDDKADHINVWLDDKLIFERAGLSVPMEEEKLTDTQGIVRIRSIDGIHYIESVMCKEVEPGRLTLERYHNIEYLYETQNQLLRIYACVLGGMLLFSLLVGGLISRSITRPIERLIHATNEFSEGRLDARVSLRGEDELAELSKHFNHMADSIREHIEKLENFTGAFAHELKTPLTSIIGYSEMMNTMELEPEERRVCAEFINRQGKRLESLSKKMLMLSGISHQKIDFQSFRVRRLFEEMADICKLSLQQKNITLHCKGEDCSVNGDFELAVSLLVNLVDNARKAVEPGGRISVTGTLLRDRKKLRSYRITVSDNGCGIPESEVSKITQAFYMVDKSRARREGGAGLGLALCTEIVRVHGWKLEVESTVGEGTNITVVIPEV